MARVRTRFPTVFVGHPFGNRFATKKFRRLFQELPFKVIYGNTDLHTRHLLTIMKTSINNADFAIFDLSDWNANVAMELGLAEGLNRRPMVEYYILLNTRRSKEVPADVRGIQRIEYTLYDFSLEVGLGDQLIQYILRKEYWVKKIWKEISLEHNARKMLLLSMKILAHIRDNEKLARENIDAIARGTHLRRRDRTRVLDILTKMHFIRKLPRSSAYRRYRNIY